MGRLHDLSRICVQFMQTKEIRRPLSQVVRAGPWDVSTVIWSDVRLRKETTALEYCTWHSGIQVHQLFTKSRVKRLEREMMLRIVISSDILASNVVSSSDVEGANSQGRRCCALLFHPALWHQFSKFKQGDGVHEYFIQHSGIKFRQQF